MKLVDTIKRTALPTILIGVFSVLLFSGCADDLVGPGFEPPPPFDTTNALSRTVTEGGLIIYVISEGNGPFEVNQRDEISVRYTARKTNGDVIDSSYRGENSIPVFFENLTPHPKNNSRNVLIEGIRKGVLGMKIREKRTLVIPSDMGYSESHRGTSGYQYRNDTLIYDIELVSIRLAS